MFKVYSSCIALTTLAFSSAQAPTSQLWLELPTASTETAALPSNNYLDSHASFFATDAFAATREYAEDNDLKRFGLDEFYLPKLEIDEPELFNWSEVERTYLASNSLPPSFGYLDNAMSVAFRNGGASIGHSAGFVGGASGGSRENASAGLSSKGASADSNTESPAPLDTTSAKNGDAPYGDAPKNESDSNDEPQDHRLAQDDSQPDETPLSDVVPPVVTTPANYAIVDEQKPVQVPVPGAFGLFVLGLAGLRLAGRKKNGSG